MDRITKSMLLHRLKALGDLTNTPTSEKDAKAEGKPHYLAFDHSNVYGGYNIVLIKLSNYSESSPFGAGRLPAREMFHKISDIISGIYIAKKVAEFGSPF